MHQQIADNDTLPVMMCVRHSRAHQVGGGKRAQDGPALAHVYCLRYSGWRQALKKQELKNTLFWWGGCPCGFVIAITIRGPDRFTEREGRREGKVCYSTRYTKGGNRERKRCGCLAVCLSALFPLSSLLNQPLVLPLCPPPTASSVQSSADSGQEPLRLSELSAR